MPKQPAAMHDGQQDRMLNLPGSGLLPHDADEASSRRAPMDGTRSAPMQKA
ncbi:hypothetical protein WJ0W_002445 [Paenibacillus melissococcoides]|uniref:Uncharacterized protein n=1 Tax=Paenibacillus melissococcoides TaxID=2912268 RepID=A0ABM9G0U5_9BACL|nr:MULTISPECIES: hypothetical protein [Paenibacillus]MEB9893073.1 hypothetical protein [Bacillus cereus]CAH8245214.1 hypothetical protein WJ0W_002445 [Paenibacillus melissococcoides]CAH8710310.1 hypothetical protein WDD9_002527 [Paenibacillus melissococcoides]CAH8711079.1 hypothetical protein HTL2_002827 [Paenibacillus melissococcoides]GIO78905.1 hypothetical protein J6TS7_25150 [Paenibacillus dendritiformis]